MSQDVNGLWAPFSPAVSGAAAMQSARTTQSELDKDAFLKLLIAQMKYQDPLNPMENKEFLAQMAQFTALEQMQNMNKSMMQSQAYSMIGKNVYAYYANAAGVYEEVEGLVTAVSLKNNETFLLVNGKDVPLSSVSVVGDDYVTAIQLNSIFEGVSSARDIALIGKYIQAITVSNGQATGFVEGVVEYVRFNGRDAILMVDGQEVFANEVASVSGVPLLIGKTINARFLNEDGEYETITGGTVKGVIIVKDKAYLQVDGKNIPIERINYATEALSYVGKEITYPGYSGVVESVTMKNGIPFFDIGELQLSYTEYRKISEEGAGAS
ncbi:MAG: hypothetical protein FWE82_07080 [Defluviitaleaceae bacterium]|nr:hypothetical protein [Defluviitaleaceae bacterium]